MSKKIFHVDAISNFKNQACTRIGVKSNFIGGNASALRNGDDRREEDRSRRTERSRSRSGGPSE